MEGEINNQCKIDKFEPTWRPDSLPACDLWGLSMHLSGFDENQIKNEQRNDPSLASVIKNCENSSDSKWNDYCLKNSILYYTELHEKSITENLVIPYQIREYVLSIYHYH
jgi:hypothetical protein